MTIQYSPKGVCAREMQIEVEDGVIKSLAVEGGCNGNLQGISRLVEGMSVDEAVRRLEGLRCRDKDTSCPDQLAKALKENLA